MKGFLVKIIFNQLYFLRSKLYIQFCTVMHAFILNINFLQYLNEIFRSKIVEFSINYSYTGYYSILIFFVNNKSHYYIFLSHINYHLNTSKEIKFEYF